MAETLPGHFALAALQGRAARYCAACAFVAATSASLRNAMTVTLRVRYYGSTTCILPSFS